MEYEPIEVTLTEAEKYELLKRVKEEKTTNLREVEKDIRNLKREDAEMDYLSGFIGAEYINPEQKNNYDAIAPLEQERERLVYIISLLENKISEFDFEKNKVEATTKGGARKTPPKPSAPGQEPQNGGADMWGSQQ